MIEKEFSGRVALITGASRGIGRQIAVKLAKAGASVGINFSNDLESARTTQSLVTEQNVKSILVQGDVADSHSVQKMVGEVELQLGPIDFLVTNAGIAKAPENPLDLDYEMWKEIMAVNVDGTFLPIKYVLDGMIERKFGRIVCISSIAGLAIRPNLMFYGTSKATVIAMVRNLASAISPTVRINSVAPGLIETDMIKTLDKSTRDNMINSTPLKRIGQAEEIAETVLFLLSEKSSLAVFLVHVS